MKTKRRLKRALLLIGSSIGLVALIGFVLIATPTEYRFGAWRWLPVLDHRLLPHLSAIFAAAFGAFFGSASAFYLGRVQQRSDRREKRHAALIAAQYALISQWNIVEAIRVQPLETFRSDSTRFAKLKLYHFPIAPTFIPFAELTFVLETEDPNILHEIHLAEQSFRASVEALHIRNQELGKFYQNPRVSHQIRDFESGAGVAKADPKEVIFLRQATDILYESVDRTLPRLEDGVEKLEKVIKSMFPAKTALKMIPNSSTPPGWS